jgi:hypothetical protein
MLKTQEHIDLIQMFEREFTDYRHDKEPKSLWASGHIYQDGQLNELFLAYRKGYALGRAKHLSGSVAA